MGLEMSFSDIYSYLKSKRVGVNERRKAVCSSISSMSDNELIVNALKEEDQELSNLFMREIKNRVHSSNYMDIHNFFASTLDKEYGNESSYRYIRILS